MGQWRFENETYAPPHPRAGHAADGVGDGNGAAEDAHAASGGRIDALDYLFWEIVSFNYLRSRSNSFKLISFLFELKLIHVIKNLCGVLS